MDVLGVSPDWQSDLDNLDKLAKNIKKNFLDVLLTGHSPGEVHVSDVDLGNLDVVRCGELCQIHLALVDNWSSEDPLL